MALKRLCLAAALFALAAGDLAAQSYGETSRIVRDDWGVPYVWGETDADAAYALAYAHAEDDFATLQEVLLMTRARLGSVQGRDGAEIDFINHFLNVREKAARGYSQEIGADTRAVLDGYAAGLNAYAEAHRAEVVKRGLFPVTGEDIVAGFVLRSPFFFGLDRVIGPMFAGEAPAAFESLVNQGSNALAIAPSFSADGATRLVSNSHQPWEGPVAWYEARMGSGEGMCFAGALFPGSPVLLMGHNRALGWTNTVNRPDLVDIYKLELDDSGRRYRFDGEWRELERERVWLRIKWGPFVLPVPRLIERSIHGPVVKNDHGAFAIRYASFDETRHVEQYYRLTRADSWADWREAMEMRAVPATNFIYADRSGNIAYLYNASFPDRAEGYDWGGVLPGEDPDALWTRLAPFEAQPFYLNPETGYLVNANNTPFIATRDEGNLDRADFPERLGIETRLTNRIRRATDLLAERRTLTREELEAIKYDQGYARDSAIGRHLSAIQEALAEDSSLAEEAELLAQWDWRLDGVGAGDALVIQLIGRLMMTTYFDQPAPDYLALVRESASLLRQHHGQIDPPLGEVLRLRRGDVDIPLSGGPDSLRAIGWAETDEGRLIANVGDSFIMFIEWDAEGRVTSQSAQPFGQAYGRPDSPHYADQADMFAHMQLKDVGLDRLCEMDMSDVPTISDTD